LSRPLAAGSDSSSEIKSCQPEFANIHMLRLLKNLTHRIGQSYVRAVTRSEFHAQKERRLNERPIEYRFAFEAIMQSGPRTVLDVGTGLSALPSLIHTCGPVVTAIDNIRDYWPSGMVNRHFHIKDEDATRSITGTFDMVTCISVLEHIKAHDNAIHCMLSALHPGGYLVLTFPYNEKQYIPNVYALPGAGYGSDLPYVAQVYSRKELDRWFSGASIVTQEYWRVFSGEFWTFGETLRPPVPASKDELHQLTCLVVQK
jgi:2-polyprenyl-3-methyl-5-hydroxy-6-metoxy-1,4-benzoquinol methylase